MSEINTKIEEIIKSNKVVLFMKGTSVMPLCGFSASVVGILNSLNVNFRSVDVLADFEIREGIKAYTNWPTIPQLFIEGEFMGGCDIVKEMFEDGELQAKLGA